MKHVKAQYLTLVYHFGDLPASVTRILYHWEDILGDVEEHVLNNSHLSQTPVILATIKTVILKEVILQLNHRYNKALLLTFIMCIADVEKNVKDFVVLKHTNAPVAL